MTIVTNSFSARRFIFKIFFLLLLIQSGCGGMFFYPDSNLYLTPERLGLKGEGFWIENRLFAWRIKPQGKKRGTVIFLHGNAQNMSSHILSAKFFPENGYELFLFDYSGFGQSTGAPGIDQVIEDSRRAVNFINKEYRPGEIILFGQSLGGAVALAIAGEPEIKPLLQAVIADSTFASWRGIFRERSRAIYLGPVGYLLSFTFSDRFAPERKVAEISPVPLILLHDSADQTVDYENSQRIYRQAQEPKYLLTSHGLGHTAFLSKKENIRELLRLIKSLRRRPAVPQINQPWIPMDRLP